MIGGCKHEWSADYVCTVCGTVRHARVPYWALILRLPSGPRGVWLALWSFWDRQIPPGPITAGNHAIAERAGGISESTLAKHLDRLEEIRGIARRGEGKRREILLVWGSPFRDLPRNIAGVDANQPPQYCEPTPAILRTNPRNIANQPPQYCDQILIDLIEDLRGVCPPAISPEVLEAIVTLDRGWAEDLRDRDWSEALAEVIRALGLRPIEVARVLAVWGDTDRALPDAPARLGAQRDGVYPPRREVWWSARHGAWLRRALGPGGARAPASAGSWVPDPCDDDGRPWAAP